MRLPEKLEAIIKKSQDDHSIVHVEEVLETAVDLMTLDGYQRISSTDAACADNGNLPPRFCNAFISRRILFTDRQK